MEDENASISYFLGTDALGRDVLSKIIAGARITVLVVIAAVGTGMIVGTTIGLVSGYFGGIIDDIVMRIVDAWNILPGLLIILVRRLGFRTESRDSDHCFSDCFVAGRRPIGESRDSVAQKP